MTAAIVLAAGKSQRMGAQKLLLPIAGQPLIAHVVGEILRSPIDRILVVVRPESTEIAAALAAMPLSLVSNPAPDGDMLSSIRCGLRTLPDDCSAFLIAPCDQPGLSAELIARLLAAKEQTGKSIAVPFCRGRRGHPVLLSFVHRDALLSGCDGIGLRGLLRDRHGDVVEVAVNDPETLADLDFPQDYARWCRKSLPAGRKAQ